MFIELTHIKQDEDGAPEGISTYYVNVNDIIMFTDIENANFKSGDVSLKEKERWNDTVIETAHRILCVRETPEEIYELIQKVLQRTNRSHCTT